MQSALPTSERQPGGLVLPADWSRPQQGRHLVIATIVSSLGGLLFGYDNIVISGAISYLARFYHLDLVGTGWAAACALVGCLLGSATAGWFVDRLGAKMGLGLCAACFASSSVGIWFAGSLHEFVIWRMIGGLGIGAASIVAPMYIAEIAPTRIRGRLVTIYQLGIVLGVFSAVLVNMLIQRMGNDAWNLTQGWRWMFLAGVVPASLFGAIIVPAVESPRWLMKMNRLQQAYATLCRLSGPETAAVEVRQIQESLVREEGRLSELFTTGYRQALLLGIMVIGLSQASGITPLFSFLPEVFKSAGADTGDAFRQSVFVCIINTFFTLLALWLVDIAGRKTLILAGTFVQFISFAAVGWLYHLHSGGTGVLLCVMGFVCAHAVGNGAVCWVIISEIFPTKVRGRAMSIATTALWLVAFLGNQAFPLMLQRLGHSGTFWCFSGAALINLLCVLLLVPETKGRSLEQIEDIWMPQNNKE